MNADVVVIGAGQNGLAAACLLARSGRKVVVLEARDRIGGLAGGEEFHPGYRTTGLLHDQGLLSRPLLEELRLEAHGLTIRSDAPKVLALESGGDGLLLDRDPERAAGELSRRSKPDVEAYRNWREFVTRVGPPIRALLSNPPSRPLPDRLSGWFDLFSTGLSLRRLARNDLHDLMRIAPMCLADLLKERFQDSRLHVALAAPVLSVSRDGPWAPGTAIRLLLQDCADGRWLAGGPAALIAALERACVAAGVEIRTGARAAAIRLVNGSARGVELSSGASIEAPVVFSSADPRSTFLSLVPPLQLPVPLHDRIRTWRSLGYTARVDLALAGALEFRGREGISIEAAVTSTDLDGLERAHDAAKYRSVAEPPALEIRVPSIADPDLAPPGHHVVSILAWSAPRELEGGWTHDARNRLLESVLAELGRFSVGLDHRLVASRVRSPAEIENEFLLAGGHLHHGEMSLDQMLFMRPNHLCSRYQTPLSGLYVCGSSTHPGGGLNVMPGVLAARELLKRP